MFFAGGIDPSPDLAPGANPDVDVDAVLSAEIFGPVQRGNIASDSWGWSVVEATAVGGAEIVPRNYHSVALLMPDGRVWCAGSSKDHLPDHHEPRMQIYEPWYVAEPRPVIASSPEVINYGYRFALQIKHHRPIQRVALVRCGSATHGFNSDQRYVGVTFEIESGSNLSVLSPPSGDVAPPGMYLVFSIDDRGVPSEGRFALLQWISLPASRPALSGFAVCPVPGLVEVFWVRPDGMVFTNARDPNINGGRWNNPVPIAPNPGSAAIRTV